jgi:hypothetical protein
MSVDMSHPGMLSTPPDARRQRPQIPVKESVKGVVIPENLLQHIKDEAKRIHHGRIIVEINADKPGKVDVITESRNRFKGE